MIGIWEIYQWYKYKKGWLDFEIEDLWRLDTNELIGGWSEKGCIICHVMVVNQAIGFFANWNLQNKKLGGLGRPKLGSLA